MPFFPGLELQVMYIDEVTEKRLFVFYAFDEMPTWSAADWDEFYGLFMPWYPNPNPAEFEGYLANQVSALGAHLDYDIEQVKYSFWLPKNPDIDDGELVDEGGQILEIVITGSPAKFISDLEEFFESFTKVSIGGTQHSFPFLANHEEITRSSTFFEFYATRKGLPEDVIVRWKDEGANLIGTLSVSPVGA